MDADKKAAARRQYEEDGFYLLPQPILSAEILEAASLGIERLVQGEYNTGTAPTSQANPDPQALLKLNDAHRADNDVRALVTHPEIGRLAAALTGVQVWASQLLIKPIGEKALGKVGWHQDRQYWQYWEEGSQLFTAWVAIGDVDVDCGPMQFVRHSHNWGFLGQGDFFSQKEVRHQIEVPQGQNWDVTPALLPAGGVSFHHCLIYHGSEANVSNHPRRSLAIHLRTERARPRADAEGFYIEHLDDPVQCPVIFEG